MTSFGMSLIDHPSDREVVFSRVLAAPREKVWRICSDAEHLRHWWGPTGYSITTQRFEFRPKGIWQFTMHGPDGSDNPNQIVFEEIEAPSRLVYSNTWDMPGIPLAFTGILELADQGSRTRLSLRLVFRDATDMRTAAERYGVNPGGVQTLDRLEQYLERQNSRG